MGWFGGAIGVPQIGCDIRQKYLSLDGRESDEGEVNDVTRFRKGTEDGISSLKNDRRPSEHLIKMLTRKKGGRADKELPTGGSGASMQRSIVTLPSVLKSTMEGKKSGTLGEGEDTKNQL